MPVRASRARIGLITLLAALLLLFAYRQGVFDAPLPQGMVEQPCPAPASGEPGFLLRLATALRGDSYRRKLRDWAQLCTYRSENLAVRAGPPPRAVMIGDSITREWGRDDPALFGSGIVNRGINSQTTPQILVRLYPDAIALRPGAIHLLAGFNDIGGKTGPISPEDFRNNIRAMADIAGANGARLVIGSITPSSIVPGIPDADRSARIVELNRWLRSFARERGLVFADYHAVLADAKGGIRRDYSDDRLHPNAAGYAAMRPVLERALAAAEASPASPAGN